MEQGLKDPADRGFIARRTGRGVHGQRTGNELTTSNRDSQADLEIGILRQPIEPGEGGGCFALFAGKPGGPGPDNGLGISGGPVERGLIEQSHAVERPQRGQTSFHRGAAFEDPMQRRGGGGLKRFGSPAVQNPLSRSALPDVGMGEALREFGGGQFGKVEVGGWARRDGFAGLIAGPHDAPDPAAFPIHTGGIGIGVLVAGIAVVPVHDPDGAVGTGLGADRHEPAVLGGEEVSRALPMRRHEGASLGVQLVDVEGVLVDVALERSALPFRGPLIALDQVDPGVGSHVMPVIDDAGELTVGVRKRRLAGLALIETTGCQVEQMINHAGTDERIAFQVEVDPPRVRGPFGVDFEASGLGMKAGDPGGEDDRFGIGILGILGLGVREDPVGHVELAIRAPDESVEQFVAIFESEAGQELRLPVHDVVSVGVLHEPKVGRFPDVHSAVSDDESGGQVQIVGKDRDVVSSTIGVAIFEDLDAVASGGARGGSQGIFVEFQHPEPAAFIPGHGHRIDDLGFAGEQAYFEARGNDKGLPGVLGGQCVVVGGLVLTAELASRGGVGVHREPEFRVAGRLRVGRGHGCEQERRNEAGLHVGETNQRKSDARVKRLFASNAKRAGEYSLRPGQKA